MKRVPVIAILCAIASLLYGQGSRPPIDKFLQLTDTPDSYTGQSGKVVSVKSTENGLEFTTPSASFDGLFTSLDFTGSNLTSIATRSYNDLQNLPTLFDGAFSSLTGKPTTLAGYGITDAQGLDTQLTSLSGLSYPGNSLKIIRVNSGETGFELATITTGVAWGSITGTLSSQTDLQSALDAKVPTSRTLTIGGTASDLSADRTFLGNVTNDAQTKSAIVPNTAPSSGQILVGNAGGTAYAPQTLSGSGATATLSSAGVLTLSGIANATLSNSAITIAGTSTALGGSITQDTITGLSSTGLVKRTAANSLTTVTDNSSNWDTAFTDRLKWDGGATGLTASTGRTSLGATTIGSNLFTLTNPSAIRFIRINADNTTDALSASDFRTAIGAGTGNGTVTDFSAGDLSPLFTTSEATTTTTPALTFSLTNAAAQTVFGNNTGSSAAPAFSSAPQFLKIGNLTSNGFVKTGSGDGTLSVDTNTYLTSSNISDTAFASSWDGVTTNAPSKNAVYDWAHTFDTDDDGLVNKLDAVSGTQSGVIAVNSTNVLSAVAMTNAAGTSTSGSAGTNVATITAGAGNQFVCVSALATQTNTASTQVQMQYTYSDSTTVSETTSAATAQAITGNNAALTRFATAVLNQTASSAKKITKIEILTAGSGTGTRAGSISALEIPQ